MHAVGNTREACVSPLPKPVSHSVQKSNELDLKYRVLRSKTVTPVKVDRLEYLLHGYEEFLVNDFRYGFRIPFVGEWFACGCPNLKSALDQPDITRLKFKVTQGMPCGTHC